METYEALKLIYAEEFGAKNYDFLIKHIDLSVGTWMEDLDKLADDSTVLNIIQNESKNNEKVIAVAKYLVQLGDVNKFNMFIAMWKKNNPVKGLQFETALNHRIRDAGYYAVESEGIAQLSNLLELRLQPEKPQQSKADADELRTILNYLLQVTENLSTQIDSNVFDQNLRHTAKNSLAITVITLKRLLTSGDNLYLMSDIVHKFVKITSLYLLATANALFTSFWLAHQLPQDASNFPEVSALQNFLQKEQFVIRYEVFAQKFESFIRSSYLQSTNASVLKDMTALQNHLDTIESDIKNLQNTINKSLTKINAAVCAINKTPNLHVWLTSRTFFFAISLSAFVGLGFYIGAQVIAKNLIDVDLNPTVVGAIMATVPAACLAIHHETYLKKIREIHTFVLDIYSSISNNEVKLREIEERCNHCRP